MPAVQKTLYIEQGAIYRLPFAWHQEGPVVDGEVTVGDPYDLTGWKGRMQIRKSLKAAPVLDLSTEGVNPRITIDGVNGKVNVRIPAGDTDLLTGTAYIFDLEVEAGDDPDEVHRLLEGPVVVKPNVTRAVS